MLKRIRRFFRDYKQFGAVLVVIVIGLGLELSPYAWAARWLLSGAALIAALPLAAGMYHSLRTGKYGIDLLAITAIVSAVLLREYWAAIILVLMLTGGRALEDYAENRAKTELDALLTQAPKTAYVLRGRKVTEVAVAQIQVGDKVIIKPGGVVPVDGEILEGTSSFDESNLTGESLPMDKSAGDTILSGTIAIDGTVTMRALHTAADSQYEQIIKLVRNAASTESPFIRLTDRYSVPFTIVSFAIAGTVWFLSGDPVRFLEVIVVATPCPLLLAAPIALISGMSRSAKHGIIVKNGTALERLALTRTIGFDKTGTLTRGIPTVNRIATLRTYTKKEVVGFAAALEQHSSHVLATAILQEAERQLIVLPKVKNLRETSGRGITAKVGKHTVSVGRISYLEETGVAIPKSYSPKHFMSTTTYVAVDGELVGAISFSDEIRPEADGMLQRIKQLGIKHTLMVTGDNKVAAVGVAKKLGIATVVADALPGDKIRAIESAPDRPVAFVGDGVNDAPVLTAADVGIALGARGSTAASETADIVIMLDDIEQVAKAVDIAKRTFAIAKQTVLIGIGLSLMLQFVFATGMFTATIGAVAQEVVDVVVIFFALRAHGSFTKKRFALQRAQ